MINKELKKDDKLFFMYGRNVYSISIKSIKEIDGVLIVWIHSSFYKKTGIKSVCFGLKGGSSLTNGQFDFFKTEKEAYDQIREKDNQDKIRNFVYLHNCHLRYVEMLKKEW
jgi:hypothetical protein